MPKNDMNDHFVDQLLLKTSELQAQGKSNDFILHCLERLSKPDAFVFVPEKDAP